MADLITSRFEAYTVAREVVEGVDLSGKAAIVTGSASGIGVETARALAVAGAAVTLAVRNAEAGERTAADIRTGAPHAKVEVGVLDLGDLATVRAFVERWGDKPLHILVNNAGVMACPLTYTVDDLEMQVGACHFGHFALAHGLMPRLEAGAQAAGRPSRVVSLSSLGHRYGPVVFEDIHYRHRAYDKWQAYGQAKSANSLFAVALSARHGARGVLANAVMPGGILTPLQRHLTHEEMKGFGWIDDSGAAAAGFKTPSQGASTSVWAAVGPELEGVGGRYLENCGEAPMWDKANPRVGVMPHALDPDAAERLWTVSAETVAA